MTKKGDGFTIIEVIIFLAITGLLLAVALVGMGGLNRDAQFRDSLDRLQSILQRQYEEVASGVNTRSNTAPAGCGVGSVAPGTSNCLNIGREIAFTGGSAQVRITDVYLNRDLDGSESTLGSLAAVFRQVGVSISATSQGYTMEWQARVPTNAGGNISGGFDRVAFIRNPLSGDILVYLYRAPMGLFNISPAADSALELPSVNIGSICISDQGSFSTTRVGAIEFVGAQGPSTITTNYTPPSGACP